MKINDLREKEESVIRCLITDITEKTDKYGNAYCTLTFTDGDSQASGNLFRVRKDQIYDRYNEHVADITMMYDGKFYNLKKICYVEDAKISDFVISAPRDPEEMYNFILDRLKKAAEDFHAAQIGIKLYEDNKDRLIYWSAAKSVHHNIRAGLLWHTYRMVTAADKVADNYEILNRSLLVTGTALHDIGKLVELETTTLGSATYGVDGGLFGHLMIGCEMITKAAEEIGDVDAEELRLLKHMIASHHGTLEFGALAKPAIPEATALNLIDTIDARMFIYERELKDIQPGEMTNPVFGMDNTCLYRSPLCHIPDATDVKDEQ